MPIRDLKCKKCGKAKEDVYFQKQENIKFLCDCGSTEYVFLPPIRFCLRFKGSGFYETDYKKKGESG